MTINKKVAVGCRTLAVALGLASGLTCCGSSSNDPDARQTPWEEFIDTDLSGYLSSVWGSSKENVFVVGGFDSETGVAFQGSGLDFGPMELPTNTALLSWVFGFGPDDVYSVGKSGSFVHFDGQSWESLDSGTTDDLWGVWGSASDDLWIVGGNVVSGVPVILHWDGTEAQSVGLEASENPNAARALFKVFGVEGKVFAVGDNGLIVELVGGRFVRRSGGENADEDFISLWGTSLEDLVIVGGRITPRFATYNGEGFDTTLVSRPIAGISAVYVNEQGVQVGGPPGFIASLDLDTRTLNLNQSADYEVHALWSDDLGTTYAVGGIVTGVGPYPGVALVQQSAE